MQTKRFATTLLLCILVVCCELCAQSNNNAIVAKLAQLNAKVTSLTANCKEVKTLVSGAKTTSQATLYYTASSQLALHYSTPANDKLIISDSQFFRQKGTNKMLYDTNKNAPVRSLSNTLLFCMQGNIAQLAKEIDADVAVEQSGNYYVVTLTAHKKAARGYKSIVLHYTKHDGLPYTMCMNEFNGTSTLYTMTNYKATTHNAANFVIKK